MFSFLRRTSLYLLAIPMLTLGLGIASNQAVLVKNHDQFPVRWNGYKSNHYVKGLEKAAKKTDKKGKPTEEAEQAAFDLEAFQQEGFLDNTHVLMSSKTHLNWMADIFALGDTTYSLGDALLYFGEYLTGFMFPVFIFDVVRKLQKKEDSV